ncbi:MAG: hypothetical protein A2735_02130 [Candidatus Yanofskybacteria bacterium RIFCSPHIGHO2_01_FULL_41_21]|uniref:Uncharacterized protein n=1 Tax=Candidatus Yanofskybacteria bacterium RIFCSPHIGHO2_01_FULL_41_21 TaxID=1802660 RepID=A0A1F8EAY7_9BACT|nr:MAG: hypothetical protein A2735_02130 [Candidatus Yanofskybacteria bacterium RIFCSPHIGHO2_01_FULL_41_21]
MEIKFMKEASLSPDKRTLSDTLRDAAKVETTLSNLPLRYAEIVRSQTTHLDSELRRQAIELIRKWIDYAEQHNVSDADPFSVRYHITRFAEEAFWKKHEQILLQEADITGVSCGGKLYRELISPFVSSEILNDKNVAVIGGTARLALKMYAGIEIQDELPINDVDIVISTDADIPKKTHQYNVDLSGAKIIDGDVGATLPSIITNFDCTMNQVAVYNGKLLFPDRALQDIKEGNIRLIAKNDPLFGSEGVVMPDGNVYLNRNGFYRGLSFLLRGKGKQLIVSEENIEAEKTNIGRYWLVMLFVKILPMKDETARRNAIAHWHDIACRIGSTQTENPELFLKELMVQYPETRSYSGAEGAYDVNAQVR